MEYCHTTGTDPPTGGEFGEANRAAARICFMNLSMGVPGALVERQKGKRLTPRSAKFSKA